MSTRAYGRRPVRRAGGEHARARAAQPRDPHPTLARPPAAHVCVGVEDEDHPDVREVLQPLQALQGDVGPAGWAKLEMP